MNGLNGFRRQRYRTYFSQTSFWGEKTRKMSIFVSYVREALKKESEKVKNGWEVEKNHKKCEKSGRLNG